MASAPRCAARRYQFAGLADVVRGGALGRIQYDFLLVADEVICGFGRTGNMSGSPAYDIRPDIQAAGRR